MSCMLLVPRQLHIVAFNRRWCRSQSFMRSSQANHYKWQNTKGNCQTTTILRSMCDYGRPLVDSVLQELRSCVAEWLWKSGQLLRLHNQIAELSFDINQFSQPQWISQPTKSFHSHLLLGPWNRSFPQNFTPSLDSGLQNHSASRTE